jgi:adenylate kinase
MLNRGYSNNKLWENLSAEILDSCLIEALQHQQSKVCEIDTTGKPAEQVTSEILEILTNPKKCRIGAVDWLGTLEKEGLTEQYLRS